jgi:hypothetical protein
MIRALFFRSTLLIGLLASPLLAGCGSSTPEAQETTAGTFSLPLTSVANGHTYRLRNATIAIYGDASAYLQSSDDPAETQLSTQLPTGQYSAYLYYYWTLERQKADGSFEPVQATLESPSSVSFSILNGTTTTVAFRFQTDGVWVTVGSGSLDVVVAVDETAPSCEPFSSDCGPGAWCPSSGLTGAARACVAEGSIALGEACAGPFDCVANATCISFGAGPVCTALCPSAEAGAPCSSGGTCQLAGDDYGVCTP